MKTYKPRIIRFKQTHLFVQSNCTWADLAQKFKKSDGEAEAKSATLLIIPVRETWGRVWRPGPIPSLQSGAGLPGGKRAAPAPGIGHLPGDGDGLRMGQDVGLWMGAAWQRPWPNRTGLLGPGDRPCCDIAGAGADGPQGADTGSWAMGRVGRALGAGQGQ